MAKIALRVYNNEIGDLIDHGQIEEAVAHCRHILEVYSKHVDTYRLLGKAYLEEQRYGDAADILQRVLSSIPEDFISQVGMSIIREDEGNLDTAIFHMERAFEVQPSNHAIQEELKRLYRRRDGIEPPKIRLTRGALARMYAHGNLHDLAIAELLAALSEDPQRYDLMVLLANMYNLADKKVEAAEICTKILEKLPYCLDGNRLLATILEVSDREENAKTYRERWEELDPYAVALDKGEINTEFVPNQTITLDRLEWEPGSFDDDSYGRPAWATSLGVDIQGDTGEGSALPDWMSRGEEEVEPAASLFGGPTEERETPPVGESTPGEESEDLESLGFTPESVGFEDTLSDSEKTPEDSLFPSEDEEEGTPEWLSTLNEEALEPSDESVRGETEETPDWMQASPDSVEPPKEENLFPLEGDEESEPEWMSMPQDESPDQPGETADEADEIPDFMSEVGWEPRSGEEESPKPVFNDALSDEQEEETAEGEIPTWMQDLAPPEEEAEPKPFIQEEVPLAGDIQEETAPDAQLAIEGEEPTEIPARLSQIEGQEEIEVSDALETPVASTDQSAKEAETPATTPEQTDEDEGLGWLESLAAKKGVAEEELVTSPEERSEVPPEWLQGTSEEDEPQPESEEEPSMDWLDQLSQEAAEEAASTPETESKIMDEMPDFLQPEEPQPQTEIGEPPPSAELTREAPPSSAEEDEGLGWLENLAAKQGVAEEELVTSPEERSDTPPDWLQETIEEGEPQPKDEEEPSLEWLDRLSLGPDEEGTPVPTSEDKPIEEPEGWLNHLRQPEEIPAAPVSEPVAEDSIQDEGIEVLEDLSAEQGADEGVEIQPEAEDELSMEWLDQLSQEAAAEAAPPEESVDKSEEEIETWLGSLGQPSEDAETPVSEPFEEEADEGLAWLETLAESGVGDEEVPEPSLQESFQEDLISDDKEDEPPDWVLPEKEGLVEETPEEEPSLEWLSEMSQESPSEDEEVKEVKVSTDWLNEMSDIEDDLETEEELGSTAEAVDKVDEWIQSLDKPEVGEDKTLEPEIEAPPIESDAGIVASVSSDEEGAVEPDVETVASHIEEEKPAVEMELESDKPMVPEWLQDVAEQRPDPDAIEKPPEWLPEVEEPIVEESLMESEEAAPTQPSEWQPESEIKAQPGEAETKPTPKPKPPPKETPDMLEEARQAVQENRLDEAIDAYSKLIKRGKAIEESIEDIEEALRKHPINPALWQVLGDALMRSDRLQEALDAYSKAEDLLR